MPANRNTCFLRGDDTDSIHGLRGTLTTIKRECGWTNQTVLRRFRKLEQAGLVRLSDVDSTWPEYDRYPRPPKAIERAFDIDTSDIREVINPGMAETPAHPPNLLTTSMTFAIGSMQPTTASRTELTP